MTKKVRFDDNVQVNKMSINLTDHIKEVKLVNDIIIDPDKTVSGPEKSSPGNTDTSGIKKYWLWILLGFFILAIMLIFFMWRRTQRKRIAP